MFCRTNTLSTGDPSHIPESQPLIRIVRQSDEGNTGLSTFFDGRQGAASQPLFPGGRVMAHWDARAIFRVVCNSDRNGRILNSDYSGRSLRVLPFRRPSGVRRLSVLSELHIGESGVLVALDLPESVQNHLMHMGFVPDAHVTALRRAPAGDPTVYGIDGMEI